jgi:hypothetical protein
MLASPPKPKFALNHKSIDSRLKAFPLDADIVHPTPTQPPHPGSEVYASGFTSQKFALPTKSNPFEENPPMVSLEISDSKSTVTAWTEVEKRNSKDKQAERMTISLIIINFLSN